MDASLQVLLLAAIIILLAKAMGHISGRFGLPLVLGELLAGVLLGPTVLNIWSLPWFSGNATAHPRELFGLLAELGVVVLMFLAGLETDIGMMKAAVRPAFWSACGGVVLPMVAGYFLSRAFGFGTMESIFIGTILTATSVTITAQTLMNMGEMQSRSGSTILGAAVIDDVLGLMVLSVVVAASTAASKGHAFDWGSVGMSMGRMVGFLAVTFILGPRLVARVFHHTAKSQGHNLSSSVALALSFLFAFAAVYAGGMAAITGAYIAGLFAAATPIRERIAGNIRGMANSFFGPLFFVSIGLEINARELGGQFKFFVLMAIIAVLGKIVGCGLGAKFTGFNLRDSAIVGIGMIPRGEVGLITASLGWASGIISRTVYMQVVVMVLMTTIVTPPLLRIAYGRREATSVDEQPAVLSKAAVSGD
jgi:Kef-type K+ transport system membrane component KefB